MNENVRIRLSVGLILLAILHAVLLGLVFPALQFHPQSPPVDNAWNVPIQPPNGPTIGKIEELPQPARVNLQAQGEIKQQRRIICPPCAPARVVLQPATNVPVVVQPTPTATPANVDATPPALWPAPTAPVTQPTPTPPKKHYQLALFLGSDSRSQNLLEWFTQHPGLAKLKTNCDFQVYTATNAIYRTRFAEVVPVSQFPVVLFQDSTGGHIHAAGHSMIPSTAGELYSDLQHGYQLYVQAKQAQVTGAVKTRGYSWDEAITPEMQLSAADCPDGFCPPELTDPWRPGDRVRDLLFDDSSDNRHALLWLSAGEIATLALVVLAVILIGFILIKRGM